MSQNTLRLHIEYLISMGEIEFIENLISCFVIFMVLRIFDKKFGVPNFDYEFDCAIKLPTITNNEANFVCYSSAAKLNMFIYYISCTSLYIWGFLNIAMGLDNLFGRCLTTERGIRKRIDSYFYRLHPDGGSC